MSTPRRSRAGMAIVHVEVEDAVGHLLIRVSTIDDVTERDPPRPGAPFADPQTALAHLRVWLEHWIAEAVTPVEPA